MNSKKPLTIDQSIASIAKSLEVLAELVDHHAACRDQGGPSSVRSLVESVGSLALGMRELGKEGVPGMGAVECLASEVKDAGLTIGLALDGIAAAIARKGPLS